MAATQEAPYDQETEKWRIEQFLKQGFTEEQVAMLIVDSVDHHDSQYLLNKKCPHHLVVDILGGGDL